MKEMMTVRSVRNVARFSSRCLFSGDDELFSCLSLFFKKKSLYARCTGEGVDFVVRLLCAPL